MEKNWRLILDQKDKGYCNMAKDEAILRMYPYQKIPTLRIYGWSNPWVSLGCNQKIEDVLKMPTDVPFVRRITGGAAILHDQEVTYSISCSQSDLNLPSSVKEAYRIICSFLKFFYCQLGLKAEFAVDFLKRGNNLYSLGENSIFGGNHSISKSEVLGGGEKTADFGSRGFTLDRQEIFCFSAWQKFDLLVNGKKIGGNAQRRTKDAIFQHGSIPQKIDFSKVKKTIKKSFDSFKRAGFLDYFLKKTTDFSSLACYLKDAFQMTFKIKLIEGKLTVQEEHVCQNLIDEKYSKEDWNVGRNKTKMAE